MVINTVRKAIETITQISQRFDLSSQRKKLELLSKQYGEYDQILKIVETSADTFNKSQREATTEFASLQSRVVSPPYLTRMKLWPLQRLEMVVFPPDSTNGPNSCSSLQYAWHGCFPIGASPQMSCAARDNVIGVNETQTVKQ